MRYVLKGATQAHRKMGIILLGSIIITTTAAANDDTSTNTINFIFIAKRLPSEVQKKKEKEKRSIIMKIKNQDKTLLLCQI